MKTAEKLVEQLGHGADAIRVARCLKRLGLSDEYDAVWPEYRAMRPEMRVVRSVVVETVAPGGGWKHENE